MPVSEPENSTIDERPVARLSRFRIAVVLVGLTLALLSLIYASQTFVPSHRAQTYSGAILLCVTLIVFFTVLGFRQRSFPDMGQQDLKPQTSD